MKNKIFFLTQIKSKLESHYSLLLIASTYVISYKLFIMSITLHGFSTRKIHHFSKDAMISRIVVGKQNPKTKSKCSTSAHFVEMLSKKALFSG